MLVKSIVIKGECLFKLACISLAFIACNKTDTEKSVTLPEVVVKSVETQTVTDYLEFTGNTAASSVVELRARVSGILTKVNFKDGDIVKEGDVLFEIEPETYAAKLALTEAQLVATQAELQRASQEYSRYAELVKQRAVAVSEVEKWKAQRDAAQARFDEAKARVELAKIEFSYTKVIAPFDGRVDRSLKDPGNLVGATEATLLTTIYRMNPIYAYFSINEKDLVKVREPNSNRANSKVEMTTEGEAGYPYLGVIDFGSSSLDTSTGTLLIRGVFHNPSFGMLPKIIPGMFVRLRVPVKERSDAILVPEQSIGVDQGGEFVLTVEEGDIVNKRPIKTGALVNSKKVIEQGLSPDAKVITSGLQRVRPGMKVRITSDAIQSLSKKEAK